MQPLEYSPICTIPANSMPHSAHCSRHAFGPATCGSP
jgi:hypothetical protein